MDVRNKLLLNINFKTSSKDIESMLRKSILDLHFTKSLNHENIYILCLLITEEHSCFVFNALTGVQAKKYTLLLHCAESLRHNINFITCCKAEI